MIHCASQHARLLTACNLQSIRASTCRVVQGCMYFKVMTLAVAVAHLHLEVLG
jgi:hypothetical protein